MIDTYVYTVKAEFQSNKTDSRGRAEFEWKTIYAQIKKGGFEYSQTKKLALKGDFSNNVPKAKVIHMTENNENIVKLEEQVRASKKGTTTIPKILFIK